MKYNIEWLLKQKNPQFTFFWKPLTQNYNYIGAGCLSQWQQDYPFEEDGVEYKTAEHYMMAGKAKLFNDKEYLRKILNSNHPSKTKKLGSQVRGFKNNIWEQHRCDIVIKANYLKFTQHPELKEYLLNTGDNVLVEASPYDRIWGIGMESKHPNSNNVKLWKGINLLGFCLMEVRDQLKNNYE